MVLVFVPPPPVVLVLLPVVAMELPSLVLDGAEELSVVLVVLVVEFVGDTNSPSEDNTHGAVWARNRPPGDPSSRAEDNAMTSKEPVPFNSTIVPDSLLVPTILPTNAVGMDGNVTIGLSLVATVVAGVVTVGGAS